MKRATLRDFELVIAHLTTSRAILFPVGHCFRLRSVRWHNDRVIGPECYLDGKGEQEK